MKKSALILNFIMLLAICIADILYITLGGLLIKGIASAMFVILGIINLVYAIVNKTSKIKFCVLIFIGLVFAMLGDIILNINFIAGAVLFAVGHIFFFASYCTLIKFNWKALIYSACLFVPVTLFIVLAPMFKFESFLMEMVCVVYALIISLMVGNAINNYIKEHSILNLIILIGSILFVFSDFMLLLNVFGGLGRIADILCLATYYPAEFFLAHSIWQARK